MFFTKQFMHLLLFWPVTVTNYLPYINGITTEGYSVIENDLRTSHMQTNPDKGKLYAYMHVLPTEGTND